MKKNTALVILIIIAIAAFVYFAFFSHPKAASQSFRNPSYTINNQAIVFTNGVSEIEAAPGSASKITTKYFGNEIHHDLNNDGKEDIIFLVTQTTGGSGTFYYVVAAVTSPEGYIGSHGYLLGDRIAPQATEMSKEKGKENIVVVNYADRNSWESFATRPSVGKTVMLSFDPETLKFTKTN